MAVSDVGKGRFDSVDRFRGLSTDSKPTNVGNGAEFLEMNTGDIYFYNEAGGTWVKGGTIDQKPTDEQVETSVTAWLDDHITEGLVVDDTLTISGAAADAKVTGDHISNIESELMNTDEVSVSKKADLTTVGNGYYNDPLVQGLTDWKANASTITYSYAVKEGEKYHIKGYSYYSCKLIYFRGDNGHTNDFVQPSTSDSSLHEYTVTVPEDGTFYIGTVAADIAYLEFDQLVVETKAKPFLLAPIGVSSLDTEIQNVLYTEYQLISPSWVDNKYINTSGTESSNTGSHYMSISVSAGEAYRLLGQHGSSMKLYVLVNEDDEVVDYYPKTTQTTKWETKEVSITVDGTLYFNTFSNKIALAEKAIGLLAKSGSKLASKTWCAIGDSITEFANGYHSIIGAETGITVQNYGKSGAGYMKASGGVTFVTVSENLNPVDIITVMGSVNDMQYVGSALGTETDTGTDTLGGCFNTVIDNLYASGNYHIGLIAPTPTGTFNGNPANEGTFKAYVDLMEKVCKRRGVPFLDLWHCSNMQPWNETFATAYMQDDTHPNADGHKIFAPRIKAFVESL